MTDACCTGGMDGGTGTAPGPLDQAAKTLQEGAQTLTSMSTPFGSAGNTKPTPDGKPGEDPKPGGDSGEEGFSFDSLMPHLKDLLGTIFPGLDTGFLDIFSMLGDLFGGGDKEKETSEESDETSISSETPEAAASEEDIDVEKEPRVLREKAISEKVTEIQSETDVNGKELQEDRSKNEKQSMDQSLSVASAVLGALGKKHKAFAIGKIVMSTAMGVQKAFADKGWPGGLVPAAKVAAKGAAQLAKVKGQFHSGITNVPSTGSYLLERGERVVDSRLNQDLKAYLGGANAGGVPGATNQNFAPQITIQGNADDSTVDRLEQMMRDVYAERLSTEFT